MEPGFSGRRSSFSFSGHLKAMKIIKILNRLIDFALSTLFVVLMSIGIYAIWDSYQLHVAAASTQYTAYRPEAEDTTGKMSFETLQAINPEVIGWLTIYDTAIDYPVTQATDNSKYVTTNALGEYSLAGCLFLDYHNSPELTDSISIIYGHHMAESAMFGDIDKFLDEDFFSSHLYGKVYMSGKEQGLEVVSICLVEAYDTAVYSPGIAAEETAAYLDNLLSHSLLSREMEVPEGDRFLLMSTCTEDVTNGRHILLARITDSIPNNPFEKGDRNHEEKK